MTTTTKTLTQEERIASRRAALTKKRDERLDKLDLPRTMTERQENEYLAATDQLDHEIKHFNRTVETYFALAPIEPLIQWRDFLISSRNTISAERIEIKSPIRNKTVLEQAQRLEWCIGVIDRGLGGSRLGPVLTLAPTRLGQLMIAAGYDVEGAALRGPNGFQDSLPETEKRIKELTQQRAVALAALNLVLEDNQQRTEREASAQAFRDALNRLTIVRNADGSDFDVVDRDGDVRDLATLTAAEREAFESFCTSERVARQATIDRQAGRA